MISNILLANLKNIQKNIVKKVTKIITDLPCIIASGRRVLFSSGCVVELWRYGSTEFVCNIFIC